MLKVTDRKDRVQLVQDWDEWMTLVTMICIEL